MRIKRTVNAVKKRRSILKSARDIEALNQNFIDLQENKL